jgi:hypothetical protein
MGSWKSRSRNRKSERGIETGNVVRGFSPVPNAVKPLFLVFAWFISATFVHAAPGVQFRAAATNIAGYGPHSVEVADLRGQGKMDIITANWMGHNVSILLGHGDGSFAAATNFPANGDAVSTATGDFDADGSVDVVVANRDFALGGWWTLLRGRGDGTFWPPTNSFWTLSTEPKSVAAGDFNQDGKLDFVSADWLAGWVEVMTNNGNGFFESQGTFSVGSPAYHVAVADLNSDGKLDAVTANTGTNVVGVLLGNGNGTFKPGTNFTAGNSPFCVAVGDFNTNGKPDIATADREGNTVSVLLGSGTGAFGSPAHYPVGSLPRSVATGDFNRDGRLDLVAANEGSNTVSVLVGNGDGTFAPAVNYKVGRQPFSVAVGDFNRDGQPDIVTVNSYDGTVSVLLNETFPVLKISNLSDQIILAWPVSATGFVLEATSDLIATNTWEAVTDSPLVIGSQQVVTNSIGPENKFYRLRR